MRPSSAPPALQVAGPSTAQIAIRSRSVHAQIRLPLDEMDLLLRLDRDLDGGVSGTELEAARANIAAYIDRHLHVAADGRAVALTVGNLAVRPGGGGAASSIEVQAEGQAASRIGSIAIRSDFLTELESTHQTQGEIRIHDRAEAFVFQPGATYERRVSADWLTSALMLIAGLLVIAALWFTRRRRAALTATLVLVASLASADVIMSAPALNATLKAMERLTREANPDATFKLGVEADALASLMNQEVESHGMQERALLDLALDRTRALGIAIVYNRDKKKFFYDGAAFREYLHAAPRGPRAADASFHLLSYQFYQLSPADIPALTAAVDATARFLANYPAFAGQPEAHLYLAVDYRDLYRSAIAAHDAAMAAKYREQARAACRGLIRRYSRTEQADAARQLLRGLDQSP